MAKKVVANLKSKTEAKPYAKVIRTLRSEKTGAYMFREDIVPLEKAPETLKKTN